MAATFERATNRADAAIHHVGGRHDIRARFGVRQRLFYERLDRRVVYHVTRIIDQTVLSVRREWIECDIGDHAEFRIDVLQCANGALN